MLYGVFALRCEAEDFIKVYSLKKDMEEKHFEIYKNHNIKIIISGYGKINASIATTYLLSKNILENEDIIFNMGIAGAKNCNIGDIFIINKIKDMDSSFDYYPDMLVSCKFREKELYTYGKPVYESISHDELCDMEGSGFFIAASKFMPPHKIFIFKVVSDNLKEEKIKKAFVISLMKIWTKEVVSFLELCSELLKSEDAINMDEKNILNEVCEKLKLTHAEKIKLSNSVLEGKVRGKDIYNVLGLYKNVEVKNKNESKGYFRELLKEF